MRNRTLLVYVAVVLMLVVLLAGCAPGPGGVAGPSAPPAATTAPPQPEPAEEGRTLVIAVAADAGALDPQVHNALNSRVIYSNIFDNLISRDREGNMIPGLALKWEAIDNTTWELTLRDGVTFHNGAPFTAADVKFWFDRMLDPEAESFYRGRFQSVSEVQVVDDQTVHILTMEPFPILPSRLTEVFPVPHEYFTEVGAEAFNENPVGTGPYKFVEWQKDDHITLVANEDYWGGAPEVKEVVFRIIPEPSTRVSELLTSGVHIAKQIPVNSAPRIESNESTSVATVPSGRVVFFFLDMLDPASPTYDVRVRKAMNYAVDKQLILDELLDGHGQLVGVRISTFDFGYDDSIEPYPYDPDRAKELLAEAGYPDGFEMVCWAPAGRYLMDKEITEAVAAQLAEVGIKLDLQFLEFSAYLEKMNSRNLNPCTFAAYATGTFDAYQMLAYNRSGSVIGYLDDPKYDALLDRAASTVDPDERLEILHQLQRTEHDNAYFLFMFQYEDLYGLSDDVNFVPRPDELVLVKDVSWR